MSAPRTTLRLAAALTAAAAALTGCTISSQPTTSSSPGTTTLRFWSYYTGTQGDWLAEQTKAFEAANPDIKVELVKTVGDQQDQKLLASVATGNGPDLFINNIVVDFPTLSSAGVMRDMTQEWESYADKAQFPDATAWRDNGKVHNLLPFTNLLGMYYNADVLKDVGISQPPTTLDELDAAMAKVKADGRYKALAMSGAPTVEGAWLFAPQMLGAGVSYCNFEGPQVEAAFDRMQSWAQQGYVPKATATWDQNASWQQFMTGKYAFALNGNWQLGNVKKAKFAWGTTQYPAPQGGTSVVFPGGEGIGIGAKSEHPAEAWKYIEQVFLSREAGESVYKAAGSIPVRADVAETALIRDDEQVQPFVKAAQSAGSWPNNAKTAEMQTALGKAVSGVISGGSTAAEGVAAAQRDIAAARTSGGGGCA